MTKKIVFLSIVLILGVLLSGCRPLTYLRSVYENIVVETLGDDSPSNHVSDDYEEFDFDYGAAFPNLYIEFEGHSYNTDRGTLSWYITQGDKGEGIEGDAGPPDMLIKHQEEAIIIVEETEIKLVFDREPTNYIVKIWNSDHYDLSEQIVVENDTILITENQDFTIYEVIAEFEFDDGTIKESGKVYYAFAVNQQIP